jgi:hypothetical protein
MRSLVVSALAHLHFRCDVLRHVMSQKAISLRQGSFYHVLHALISRTILCQRKVFRQLRLKTPSVFTLRDLTFRVDVIRRN